MISPRTHKTNVNKLYMTKNPDIYISNITKVKLNPLLVNMTCVITTKSWNAMSIALNDIWLCHVRLDSRWFQELALDMYQVYFPSIYHLPWPEWQAIDISYRQKPDFIKPCNGGQQQKVCVSNFSFFSKNALLIMLIIIF